MSDPAETSQNYFGPDRRRETDPFQILGRPRMQLGSDRFIRQQIAKMISEEMDRQLDWVHLPKFLKRPSLHPLVLYNRLQFLLFALIPHTLIFVLVYLLAIHAITPFVFAIAGVAYIIFSVGIVVIASVHTSRVQRVVIAKIMQEHPEYQNFLHAYAKHRLPFDDVDRAED